MKAKKYTENNKIKHNFFIIEKYFVLKNTFAIETR